MRTRCDISAKFDIGSILSKLAEPTCAERAAEVPERRLAGWANAMAKLRGYRHSPETLDALHAYLAGYGLLLMGGVGTGKTEFFRAVSAAGRTAGRAPVALWQMMDCAGRTVAAIREAFASLRDREVVLDDVGAEPKFSDYGSRWEILPWIIELRMASPERTHFTTNLTARELEARYGARTVDRMHEMAASVAFAGKSRRRTRPNAIAVRAWSAAKEGIPA